MAKARLVPTKTDPMRAMFQSIGRNLRAAHGRIDRIDQRMKTPTMPLYDPDFPEDAVDGQHALHGGWLYMRSTVDGEAKWRPYITYVGTAGVDGVDSLLTAESPPFENGCTNTAGGQPVFFGRSIGFPALVIGGDFTVPDGVVDATVFTLPDARGYRPEHDTPVDIPMTDPDSIARVVVQADGQVVYKGPITSADSSGSTIPGGSVGQYGTASAVPQITVDSSGRVILVTNVSIQIAEAQVTGLVADLAAKIGTGDAAGGDLAGTFPDPTVAQINGSPLGDLSAPALGDRLRWNGLAWVPSSLVWRPVMTLDPTTGQYLPVVTGDGEAVMTEA